MDEAYGKINIIPEVTRVVDMVVGRTAEAYKILPGFGVQVWVKERGMELENWPWKMVTIRQPRLIKRYPRPFRFPREEPTKQCHCRIGRMRIESLPDKVVCDRCKNLIGSESFPRRIDNASNILKKEIRNRFWENVVKLGPKDCWPWTGSTEHGYGVLWYSSSDKERAHRISYRLFVKDSISPGNVVRHSCDNKPCVNWNHLIQGTQAENVQDRVDRGRSGAARGEKHGRSKLTWEKVKEIRSLYASNQYYGIIAELARKFSISEHTIRMIVKGRYWRTDEKGNELIRKADNEIQRGGAKVHKGVSRRRKRTSVRRNKVSVKARKRSKSGVVVRPKRSSNATKSTKTRKGASLPAKRRRPRKISERSHPTISKVQRQVAKEAGAK